MAGSYHGCTSVPDVRSCARSTQARPALRYMRDGEPRVVILDGWSVAHARMCAAGLEPGVFVAPAIGSTAPQRHNCPRAPWGGYSSAPKH